MYKFLNRLFDKQYILLFQENDGKTEKQAKPKLSLEFVDEKRRSKKPDQKYGKNTMDSQEIQGKKPDILTKSLTPTKRHSISTVGHTPPKRPFIPQNSKFSNWWGS